MITSANIKTHSGIININNTLIQWGAKGGELCCSCASAIKIIRGESQAEPAEKEEENSAIVDCGRQVLE